MSVTLKHFFDTIYYPCLTATVGRPYGLFVHGNLDVDGAIIAVEKIVTGLQWTRAQAPVTVLGTPSREDLDACYELLTAGGRLVANAVTAESEAVLAQWHSRVGGGLRRFQHYHGEPLGEYTGWRPAMPVTQWVVSKQ